MYRVSWSQKLQSKSRQQGVLRNRRQLIPTGKHLEEKPVPDQPLEQMDKETTQSAEESVIQLPLDPGTISTPSTPKMPVLHRSEQVRRAPSWIDDYIYAIQFIELTFLFFFI